MASGSANFQESSAVVGDTLHADFTWSNAVWNASVGFYAVMWIIDPEGTTYDVEAPGVSSGSHTLSCVTDKLGTWVAKIMIWQGTTWLTYTDTISVTTAGVTSGSANFQESSAVVGDTLHANFTWANAKLHWLAECYSCMYIYDPNNVIVAAYDEQTYGTGSKTLSFVTDVSGTWKAEISVWNGSSWLTYTDTVSVSEPPPASGAASFQESSAVVGDTLHASFAWADAVYNYSTMDYAEMRILDPDNINCAVSVASTSSGSRTLSCVTDKLGTWTARIEVWNGSSWLTYTDTVYVSSAAGAIAQLGSQSVYKTGPFPPDTALQTGQLGSVEIMNVGNASDQMHVRIYEYPQTAQEKMISEFLTVQIAPGTSDIYPMPETHVVTPSVTGTWSLGVKVFAFNDESEPSWGTSGTSIFNVGIGENGEIPWGTILAVGGAVVVALFATVFLARR